MGNYTTGRKYREIMDKVNILGVERQDLNGWAEVLKTDDYLKAFSSGTGQNRVDILEDHHEIKLLVESMETIINNVEGVTYHQKYLIIEFKDKESVIITSKGKIVDLEKEIISNKIGERFKLEYRHICNYDNSKFMVVWFESNSTTEETGQPVAIINEDGVVLKINTGLESAFTSVRKVANLEEKIKGKAATAIITVSGTIDGVTKVGKMISVTDDLEVVREEYWQTDEKLTWEYM